MQEEKRVKKDRVGEATEWDTHRKKERGRAS